VGPNDLFLVYVTNYGQVLAYRFGASSFVRIANMKREFSAHLKGVEPAFTLSFHDNGRSVTVIIEESVFGQTIPVVLPREITY
jgi:hypothetical protein